MTTPWTTGWRPKKTPAQGLKSLHTSLDANRTQPPCDSTPSPQTSRCSTSHSWVEKDTCKGILLWWWWQPGIIVGPSSLRAVKCHEGDVEEAPQCMGHWMEGKIMCRCWTCTPQSWWWQAWGKSERNWWETPMSWGWWAWGRSLWQLQAPDPCHEKCRVLHAELDKYYEK